MPPRKKKRVYRKRKKRTYRPRRAILSGFPKKKIVKLRYTDSSITLDAASQSTAQHVFRANSVFDPDYTAAGHQPMAFDQWALLYQRYTVLGSKITVRYTPTSASNLTPAYMGCTLGTVTNPLANFTTGVNYVNNILESKQTGNYQVVGTLYPVQSSKGPRYASITKTFSAKKFFGKVNVQDGNSTSAAITANPSDTAYYSVWMASIDSNNPAAITVNVSIDYIVMFHEPIAIDGS